MVRQHLKHVRQLQVAALYARLGPMGTGEQTGSRIAELVAALIIREAILHRLFGRKTLCIGLADIVAALGTGFCVIFPSLMIGIDQGIVSEHRNTFGESINGVLLCGSEHFESLSLGDNVTEVYRF